MFPKKTLLKLPKDTPPSSVQNQRQFHGFLGELKYAKLCLCVEFTETEKGHHNLKRSRQDRGRGTHEDFEDDESDTSEDSSEDLESENDRFDFFDDSDGASSGDEDFRSYGTLYEKEDEKPKVNLMKKKNVVPKKAWKRETVVDEDVTVDLKSLGIRVGDRFPTKAALVRRLRILTVVHQFDYRVKESRGAVFSARCWVEGCSWRIRATIVEGDSSDFHVKVMSDHTCSVTERSRSTRQANKDILANLYNDLGSIDSKVVPTHVGDVLNKHFKIKVCLLIHAIDFHRKQINCHLYIRDYRFIVI